MTARCDVIVIFSIYGQSGAIRKPDSGHIVCKLIFSLEITFYLTKVENRTKLSHSSHTITLNKGTTFAKKCWFFAKKKNAGMSKIKKALALKAKKVKTWFSRQFLERLQGVYMYLQLKVTSNDYIS